MHAERKLTNLILQRPTAVTKFPLQYNQITIAKDSCLTFYFHLKEPQIVGFFKSRNLSVWKNPDPAVWCGISYFLGGQNVQ